ncbi:hypothetical protein SDC9_100819 [bioreactor metagenome]|uniref:Uncharacterized protein n=1 Tax=bioreactor metagenome TaxID=1076179 RepID=A0A645AMA0_9ZZZZ
MKPLDVTEFLSGRMDEIISSLKENNTEFALSAERSSQLLDDINWLMSNTERTIALSPEDCMNVHEFFEQELTQEGIMQQELYKQGYLDCIKLLRMLKVIR